MSQKDVIHLKAFLYCLTNAGELNLDGREQLPSSAVCSTSLQRITINTAWMGKPHVKHILKPSQLTAWCFQANQNWFWAVNCSRRCFTKSSVVYTVWVGQTAQESCLIKHLKKPCPCPTAILNWCFEIMQVLNRFFSSNIVAYLLLQVMQVFLLISFCFANSEKIQEEDRCVG